MNNRRKKEILFNIYSKHFEYIKENSSLKDTFDKGFGFYCPICINYFEEKDIHDSINPLTIEHNPPKSLGGKSSIITCKKCNSQAGHKIDNEVLKTLLEIDSYNFKPNSETRTKFYNDSTNGNKINGNIKVENDGKFIISLDSKNNNPEHYENFIKSEEYEYNSSLLSNDPANIGLRKKMEFKFEKAPIRDEKLARISLLKIAYLLAFEKLGYLYIFNKNSQIIRDQINQPEKDIIKDPFWINYKFPDKFLGINIITKPRELRSILVVYDLKTKSDTYRISICLPGLSVGDEKIYENIKLKLCMNGGFENIEVNNYINSNYDIKNIENTFHLIDYWKSDIDIIE